MKIMIWIPLRKLLLCNLGLVLVATAFLTGMPLDCRYDEAEFICAVAEETADQSVEPPQHSRQ